MEGESRLWDGAFRVQYQLGSVPNRRVPMDSYRETDRLRNDERGWKEEAERAGKKELDGTSNEKDDGIGNLMGWNKWWTVRWKMWCRKRMLRTERSRPAEQNRNRELVEVEKIVVKQ